MRRRADATDVSYLHNQRQPHGSAQTAPQSDPNHRAASDCMYGGPGRNVFGTAFEDTQYGYPKGTLYFLQL